MPQNNIEDWESEQENWESAEAAPRRALSTSRPNAAGAVAGELTRFLGALWRNPRGRSILLGASLFLCGACAFGAYLGNYSFGRSSVRGTPTSQAETNANGTPSATNNPSSGTPKPGNGSGLGSNTGLGGYSINGTPVPAAQPIQIRLGGTIFNVLPMQIDAQQNASYDRSAATTAFWFPGSYINYMLGVHASAENNQLITSYKPGDVILMDTGAGTLRYQVDGLRTIKTTDIATLRGQSTPQLTLILMGSSGENRNVLVAKYLDEGVPNVLNPMRFPINIGDMRVRVSGEKLVPGSSIGLPPGRNYYQINAELSNISNRPLDSAQFVAEMLDGGKNKYALSRQASSASGGLGWPTGVINPGQTINVVAGFDVPDNMPGPRLEWRFAPSINTPSVAMVSIPFTQLALPSTPVPAVAPSTEVVVLSASLDPATNLLRITGMLSNKGTALITVNQKDLSLSSGSNSVTLTGVLPPLKWEVPPGPGTEPLNFILEFQRPPGGAPAVFKLLDQSFEIGGL